MERKLKGKSMKHPNKPRGFTKYLDAAVYKKQNIYIY